MYTYEVWVRDQAYHGKTPLTYTHIDKLSPGTVVKVNMRSKTTLGIVRREAPAPKGISMKPIEEVLFGGKYRLSPASLKLLFWLTLYYPAPSSSITQLFIPANMPKQKKSETHLEGAPATPGMELKKTLKKLPKLTTDQQNALNTIQGRAGTFLLHGDTGSGKTRVYIECIKVSLLNGKSSLVLVPEIGLVPHLRAELEKTFNQDTIKVLHSGLTLSQRRNIWTEIISSQQPIIVIGPRSALFAPISNIGLIVVDESHDDGYKQDNTPYYNSLRVASKLAQLHEATLIMGSATPSISDLFIAKEKQIPVIRMKQTAVKPGKHQLSISLVNKVDKKEFTKSSILSNTLILQIKQQLEKNQQSLLFLNRRGSAKIIICTECSWRKLCPNCDLPMTLHEDSFLVMCHTCGKKESAPICCKECNNPNIIYLGPGTKSVEKEINNLFPEASIARFDGDNKVAEKLDKHTKSIVNGSIDIIIGTQVLVKGFDIPKLGLVGIIDADSSLSFPDFSAEERTFQLISQAIGRVGRGHTRGVVVLQSFQPKSAIIKQSTSKDWECFYAEQLSQRKSHNFPPFTFLLKLECSRKKQQSVKIASNKLVDQLNSQFQNITILGPSPAFKEKRGGEFTWQVIVKSSRRSILVDIINKLPSGWKYDIDPTQLL